MMETQFAYGSNMDPNQLANKGIKMRNPRIAKLEGYKFGFTKVSTWDGKLGQPTRKNGKANITQCEDSNLWGVLLDLTEDEVVIMDDSEGTAKGHYRREDVNVVTDSGLITAVTYVACTDKLISNTSPLDWYLKHVTDGAEKQGLPPEYVKQIETLGFPSSVD